MSAAAFIIYKRAIPDWNKLYAPRQEKTILYDSGYNIIAEECEFCREAIPLEKMGLFPKVAVAVEDKDFWTREFPLSFKAIMRAFYQNWKNSKSLLGILKNKIGQGGSTITQQITRDIFFPEYRKKESEAKTEIERNLIKLERKFLKEIPMAFHVENKLSRKQILELYLNNVYCDWNRYGVEAASQFYFKRHASELNIPETAMIVGLFRSPGSSPFRNPEKARKLRRRVLQQLADAEIITPEEKVLYDKFPLPTRTKNEKRFEHFTSYVKKQLNKEGIKIVDSGLRIYTTIRSDAQTAAESAAREAIKRMQGINPELTDLWASVVAMDIKTGAIVTFMQIPEFSKNQFLLVQFKKQVGSAIKPFFYAKLLQKGYRLRCDDEGVGPCELIDLPVVIQMGWRKFKTAENYPYENLPRYRGVTSVITAFAESRNCPPVRAMKDKIVTESEMHDLMKHLNIYIPKDPNLTLVIGSVDTDPLTFVSAYTALIGPWIKPYAVEKIIDVKSKKDITPEKPKPETILIDKVNPESGEITRIPLIDPKIQVNMLRLLRAPVLMPHGTAQRAARELKFDVFAKTGTAATTEKEANVNIVVGGTSRYIAEVIIFRESGLPFRKDKKGPLQPAGKNALPVFIELMKALHKNNPPEPLPEITDPRKPMSLKKLEEFLKNKNK